MRDFERCWQAVLARDAEADGTFVYGVRSTGVYCRPSCPSRRPRRERVVFFPGPELAERAGFRPCRRCRARRPDAPDSLAGRIRQACRLIEADPEGRPTLADLGARVGLSPQHLQRTFKRIVGIAPRAYAEACRLGRLKARLREGDDVTRSLHAAGYGSSSRLYERSDGQLGMTPATYRRGGLGMRIGYTLADCPLGRILIAATGRGLCAVYLGDADGPLEEALAEEYPAAEVRRDDDGFRPWVDALLAHLDDGRPLPDLPLDFRTTAFRWRVYEALRAIPPGQTRTYGELARELGEPGAARAVGRACATNPVSVVIPCHRVLRGDGDLGGYRWDVSRKRALLDRERRDAAGPSGLTGPEKGVPPSSDPPHRPR
jgi:AraC family transcriptional regulator, regulatory protein of adaptative response / methylated-DNA-[protein]-cysteine methyltransferase